MAAALSVMFVGSLCKKSPAVGPGGNSQATSNQEKESQGQTLGLHPDTAVEGEGRKLWRVSEGLAGSRSMQVKVREGQGNVIAGDIAWVHSPDPIGNFDRLESLSSKSDEVAAVHTAKHNGRIEIAVPKGHWTWLRVTAIRGNEIPLVAYRRVAPFQGSKQLLVEFDVNERRLHVFVLNEDMTSRAKAAEIQVFWRDLKRGGPASYLKTVKTDRFGYVCVAGVKPGLYVLVAGTRGLRTAFPHCARLVLPVNLQPAELCCTLVVPEPSLMVKLRIEISGLSEHAVTRQSPRLFLQSVGSRHGLMFPIPGTFQRGPQTRTVEVPRGSYEVGVLPQGELVVSEGSRLFEVARDCEIEVKLARVRHRTLVELEGIRKREFPIRVYRRHGGALWDATPELLFVGPYSWRGPKASVPVSDERCSLVGVGRQGTWISRSDVVLKGTGLLVPMKPATLLFLHVWDNARSLDPLKAVEVTWAGRKIIVALRRKMHLKSGLEGGLLAGSVVVPRGSVAIKAYSQLTGAVIWSKLIQANDAREVVSIKL